MVADRLGHDRQAQTLAAALGGYEGIEKAALEFFGNTRAVVLNRDHQGQFDSRLGPRQGQAQALAIARREDDLTAFGRRGIFRKAYLEAVIDSVVASTGTTFRDVQLVSTAWDVMMLEMWFRRHEARMQAPRTAAATTVGHAEAAGREAAVSAGAGIPAAPPTR